MRHKQSVARREGMTHLRPRADRQLWVASRGTLPILIWCEFVFLARDPRTGSARSHDGGC